MDIAYHENGLFRFGPFRLDLQRRTLTRDGEPVVVQGRAFDTLAYVVRNHDRVVTREELLAAVWAGRVVQDNNLAQAISVLRRSLLDKGGEAVVLTVPGRGYQLGYPVRFEPAPLLPCSAPAPESERLESEAGKDAGAVVVPAPLPLRRRWRWAAPGGAYVLLVVSSLLWRPAFVTPPLPKFEPPPRSLAVLAFENLTGDASQDYLAGGIADELTEQLGRIGALHVVARRSAFLFKGQSVTAAEIARRLGVAAVLDGSLHRDGGGVRLSVQLIDGVSGFRIWGADFPQGTGVAAALEPALAGAVLGKLSVTLKGDESAQLTLGGTTDAMAMDAYLRARRLSALQKLAGTRAALTVYEFALARDPNFAMAHLGRADMLSELTEQAAVTDMEGVRRTEAEAEAEERRAIALAPALGAAHAHLASRLAETHLDFAGALAEAEHARLLAPGDANSLQLVAFVQACAGQIEAAVETAKAAAALDPLTPSTYRWLASTLVKARDFRGALAALRHARENEPALTTNDHYLAAESEYGLGHPEAVLREAAEIDDWARLQYRAMAYHALGQDAEAARAMTALQVALGEQGLLQYAEVYAQWGRMQDALAALREAYRKRDSDLVILGADFLLDPVANTEDFREIRRGLAEGK